MIQSIYTHMNDSAQKLTYLSFKVGFLGKPVYNAGKGPLMRNTSDTNDMHYWKSAPSLISTAYLDFKEFIKS